jgi:hypothetical protein
MAHIVLADFMGVKESEAVPMWLNEGIAQSSTNEGRSRVGDFARYLGYSETMMIPCQLEGPINTFAHGEGNFQCYPEYYIAAERLRQIGGPWAVGRVLRSLREGHPIADAFFSATGREYSFFQQDVDTYMADVITDRKQIP